ncbi:serine hydrolase domain-containing protein [Phenylobacterium sp. VNQ135]|uniref:serine hydrolase domain-containing protein n=1 Tax=Phenylobacterium sp. VNQ135 TaxID=3400922 RepID=UPI003C0CECB0
MAALAALVSLTWANCAAAQEAPQSVAAALPDAPIPYSQVRPKRPQPKARTAPTAPARAPAAAARPQAPTIAGAPPSAAALPTQVSGARLASNQPIPAAELEAFVDGWVKDAMAREHVAGAAVSVVQGGQVTLKKGYGFAGLGPRKAVDPDRTLFRVGSISKTFTWILAMKEVEKGRLALDRPINTYLPDKVRVRDEGYRRPITLKTLMSHSPGFEDRALGQLFERDPARVRPLDLYLRQERPARVRAAGVLSSYSNYGTGLAGLAVANLNRKPFETLVEEQITGPLGMQRTTFREPRPERRGLPAAMPQALRGDVATGYWWTGAGYEPRPYEYIGQIAPAGAASSTAGDMARYMLMLLGNGSWNGVTVYGPQAARAFRQPIQATAPGINGWAHGFIVYDLPGGRRGYGHNGATLSFHSSLVVIPELDLGVFITTNSDEGSKLSNRFVETLVRQFYAPPVTFPRAGSSQLRDMAGAFEGYYVTTRRAHGGLEGFVNLLIGGSSVRVTPEGRLLVSGQDGPRLWVPEGPIADGRFIAADGDRRIAFIMKDGRAAGFTDAFNADRKQRAAFWMNPLLLGGLALLAGLAAVATLLGAILRNRRDVRENQIQARAALAQNIQAGLWLATFALVAAWAIRAADVAAVFYAWPGVLLITASACALVAAALTLVTVVVLPAVWQGGRRVDSWSLLRKTAFTTTVVIYAAFSVALGLWGLLAPWSA